MDKIRSIHNYAKSFTLCNSPLKIKVTYEQTLKFLDNKKKLKIIDKTPSNIYLHSVTWPISHFNI